MQTSATKTDFRELPIHMIDESPTNPRKRFDADELTKLAESISEKGLIEPIAVRAKGSRFELIVGARRLRASKLAALEMIPARIMELDDEQALEVQVIENNQREGVTPTEEADALLALHEQHGRSVEVLAKRLGRPPAFVQSRLALARAPEPLRNLVEAGDISLPALYLVLRAPADQIQDLTKRVTKLAENYRRRLSRSDVHALVTQYVRALSGAPFALDDAKLTKRGACTSCPSRTGAQRGLFGESGADDRCLDAECWDEKIEAIWSLAKKDAKKRKLEIIDDYSEAIGKGWRDADQRAWVVGDGKKTYGELAGPKDLAVAQYDTGSIVRIIRPEAIERIHQEARDGAAGMDDSDDDGVDDAEDSNESGHGSNPDWYVKGRQRRWDQAREREATVRRIEAIGERELLIWLLGKVQYPVDVAFGRKRLALLEVDGNSIAKLTAWAETASTNEILAALVEDAWISGCLDDETTLDGLIEASDAPEQAAQ